MVSMSRTLVVVDPGHGGNDPGAENFRTRIRECDINLDIALMFSLRAQAAFDVILTRTKDETVSLQERARLSNYWLGDIFLSFHSNAAVDPSARGFEVWTTLGETKADSLATAIYGALVKAFPNRKARPAYDDGDPDKETQFYVLRHTAAPAVLIEFGFISNDEESAWLDKVQTETEIAQVLVEAVRDWLKEVS